MTRLTIYAALDSVSGYGYHLTEMVRGLEGLGLFVSIRASSIKDNICGARIPADILSKVVHGRQPEEWELLLGVPSMTPTAGRKTIFYTMYEGSVLPGNMVENLNRAEVVIVPCRWNKECFEKSGARKPIFIVPLGIDPAIFYPRPMPLGGVTVFSAAGRTSNGRVRKGLDAVIRTFSAAFPYDRNVRLQIKCHADCALLDIKDERITVERRQMSLPQIADWLAQSHCFVSAATAEGWGLWQHQAAALGRPVICSVYGGLQEFLGYDNCYPVRYREVNAAEHFGGQWAMPDLMHMAEQMRRVNEGWSEAAQVGMAAAHSAAVLPWDRSIEQLYSVLECVGAIPRAGISVSFSPSVIQADYSIPKIPSVAEQCRERGWGVTELVFEKEPHETIFNPSVVAVDGNRSWFVRKSTGSNNEHSRIFAFYGQSPVRDMKGIVLPGMNGDSFEDPRVIVDHDVVAMSYTRVSPQCFATQEIAFLDMNLNVQDVWHIDFGGNGSSPRTATRPEKNWPFFKHDGHWHFIHWLSEPTRVVRVKAGRVDEVFESHHFLKTWKHGVRHGGSHPVRIGDEYWGWCHSLLPWHGMSHSRYFVSAYAFAVVPPFQLTRLSREPLLRSDDDWDKRCSCVIAGGAIFDPVTQHWTLAVGARDNQCLRVDIPHADVMKGMVEV